ncbi:MAG TPA: DinB family protein [Beijerinckiaceae bacterium]|nr:DinB family protein [Beijerinckiaceae bacterium]
MITPDYVRTMARYNRWQNGSLYSAAGTVSEAARREGRGAFFGSIHGTLSHLFWGDSIWFSRFADWPKPSGGIKDSPAFRPDWAQLSAERETLDAAIIAWADALDPDWLTHDLVWFSGALGRELRRPRALLVVHFFNHQTHHRGQVHAMLTAAGAKPDDTDLMIMPGQ